MLKGIINRKDNSEAINTIDDFLFSQSQPRIFYGKESVEVGFMKNFEDTCITLNQHVPKDPKKMNVLEYFQTIETLKKQFKEVKKRNKKR